MSKKGIPVLPDVTSARALITKRETKNDNNDRKFDLTFESLPAVGSVSSYNMERISMYKKQMDLLPDLELLGEVLVSSVISPNDAVDVKISILNGSTRLSDTTKSTMNTQLENDLDKYYNLNKDLYDIAHTMMVTKGAKCYLVTSRSGINNYIEEQYKKGIENIKKEEITLESLIDDLGIVVNKSEESELISFTDNMNILNLPEALKITGESYDFKREAKSYQIDEFFKDLAVIQKEEEGYLSLDGTDDERPIILDIPMEAVIPIINNGDPEDHKDYLILLDKNGNPIRGDYSLMDSEEDIDLTQIQIGNQDTPNNIIDKSKRNQEIADKEAPVLDFNGDSIRKIIDDNIKKTFENKNGLTFLDDKFTDNVIKTMLNRVLAQQETRLLYVRKENLAYMAIDYKDNGTGVSILDKLFYNSSIRALMETAKVTASIRNNIPRKEYTITLDEDDQDPDVTSKQALHYILKSEQEMLPTGLMKPQDLSRWATSIGIIARFKHKKLPNIEVDFEEKQHSIASPDDDTLEKYADKASMKFGISPEILKAGRDTNFAITEIYKNSLQAKRMLRKQAKLESELNKFIRLILTYDGEYKSMVMPKILKDVKDYKRLLIDKRKGGRYINSLSDHDLADVMYNDYIRMVTTELPKPDIIAEGKIKDDYEDFNSVVDSFLDLRLDSDAMDDELVKGFTDELDKMKATIKGVLAERWLKRNNMLPELTELFTDTPTRTGINSNVFLEQSDFIKNVETSFIHFLKREKKLTKSLEKKYEKILNNEDEEEETNNGNNNDDQIVDENENEDGKIETSNTEGDENTPPDDSNPSKEEESAGDTGNF